MTHLSRTFSALSMLALPCVSGACAGGTLPLPDGEVEPPVSVDRIRDKPDGFIGERVRLAAEVAESHGDRVFILRDDDPVLKEQLLVVTRRPLHRLLAEERTGLTPGDKLLVTGVIQRGDVAAIEAELGIDLEPRLERRFRGKPLLVASEVVRTGGQEPEAPDTLHPRD